LKAVHLRHQHVTEYEIGGLLLQVLHRQASVTYCRALVPLSFEQRRDDIAYRLFVIHNEYLSFAQLPGLPGWMHQ
jgi:hypothetical protein